jgi:hypothetical protein
MGLPVNENFAIEPHGRGGASTALVRYAVPRNGGDPYRHVCPLAAFEATAHAVAEAGDRGFTLGELWALAEIPCTQVATAVAFLKERGIVLTRGKRNYPAGAGVHLDAMTEYWALLEEPKEAAQPGR